MLIIFIINTVIIIISKLWDSSQVTTTPPVIDKCLRNAGVKVTIGCGPVNDCERILHVLSQPLDVHSGVDAVMSYCVTYIQPTVLSPSVVNYAAQLRTILSESFSVTSVNKSLMGSPLVTDTRH